MNRGINQQIMKIKIQYTAICIKMKQKLIRITWIR